VSIVIPSRAARLAGAVLLALCALRLWHLLLLRQSQDAPLVVAAWLVAFVGLTMIVRPPTRMQAAFTLLLAVMLFLFHWGFERAASDGREYFVQVRSLVMDRDFDFTNEDAVLGARGAAKMYPFGLAILWAPFMVLAHGWLALLNLFGGAHTLDGYTNPYQRAVGLGTLLYGFTGFVLAFRIMRDYFSDRLALVAVVATAAGTFALWYLVVESSMSHGVSMFAATLFLYVWHRARRAGLAAGERGAGLPIGWWLALGLSAGVMAMVRWQNITIAIVPSAILLWEAYRRGDRWGRGVGAMAVAGLVGAFPQLLFWRVVRGGWISLPAGDHGWNPTELFVADILWSSNHGLFATTPLVLFAVLGLGLFFRRDRTLALALTVAFLFQVLANSASGDWWGGPGFGARRFDSCFLAFAVGLAALLTWLRRRPFVAPAALLAAFVGLNVLLMIDVRSGLLPAAAAITVRDATESVYRRLGNPFSFPFNAWIAWKYDADWSLLDRLEGRRYFNVAIDFGLPGDDTFLSRGWSEPELGDGQSFRWATGDAAAFVVPFRAAGRYRLEIVCAPFVVPNGGRQSITLVVNDVTAGRIALNEGMQSYAFDIPPDLTRAGLNLFRFEFRYAMSPQALGTAPDARPLAVMFDSLRLIRQTGNAP
jgi:hypothetical protein